MNHLVASVYFLAAVIAIEHGDRFTMFICVALACLCVFFVPPQAAQVTIINPPGIKSEPKWSDDE